MKQGSSFKLRHIFLTGGLIELAVGLSDAGDSIFFQLGRPVGIVLIGLFLIFTVLEKESALLDEQEKEKLQEAEKDFREVAATPALTTVQSH